MDAYDTSIALKERLILAGIDEISQHGTEAVSLRKIASACGASCAAPYKHFKNKDDFLDAAAEYPKGKWKSLSEQIISLFDDEIECICELCIANIKFALANSLYAHGQEGLDDIITERLRLYCSISERPPFDECFFKTASIVRGAGILISDGTFENSAASYETLRKMLRTELKG